MRAGIDLGGTKTEIIVLDDEGQAIFRHRQPTPADSYQHVLANISDLFTQAEQRCGRIAQVGIGTPGSVSRHNGLIRNSNSQVLNGQPLLRDLEHRLQRSVRIANDANCFALSEAIDGAAAGAQAVFGVIIGTGVGGGLIIDQRVREGCNGIAGEWGHNPLPWPLAGEGYDGPACYCGHHSCIETFLSGPGLAADHLRIYQQQLTAEQIAARAAAADEQCQHTLARYVDRLARGLAHIVNTFDPDVIVLGGGLSNIKALYDQVPLCWGQYIFSDQINTRLVQARHGDSSGVRGAAWLWPA